MSGHVCTLELITVTQGSLESWQGITPLKGRMFYSNDCGRQFDNSQRLAILPRLPVNGMQSRLNIAKTG